VNPKSGQFKDLAAQLRSAAEELARAYGRTLPAKLATPRLPARSGAAPTVICPKLGQCLRVGDDDVPEVIGRLARCPYPHCLRQGRDGDPYEGERQRNGPWRLSGKTPGKTLNPPRNQP
jgi:hypothetical protein